MTVLAKPRRAAFFDVDETLIASKSMFEFLRFWLAQAGDDGGGYRLAVAELSALASAGLDRTAINRAYYRLYASASLVELLDAGERWYATLCRQPDPYLAAGLSALTRHRAAGDVVVLVSGSFRACLGPIAAHVGAGHVLCTEPLVDEDGRLTGDVRRPMIGGRKADAVAEMMRTLEVDPELCYAYGDHASDLEMLSLVGHAVVVGSDPVLASRARVSRWRVLPATRAPAPRAAS